MSVQIQVGLIGGTGSVATMCREALESIGTSVLLVEPISPETLQVIDMMLLVLQPPYTEMVRRFGQLRESAPHVPVLLLASGLDVNDAVELVKFGAVDLLELPATKRVLARKIERALRGTEGLTVESTVLWPLVSNSRSTGHESQRNCFRTLVPEHMNVSVTLQGTAAGTRVRLVDLSMRSEKGPAGMCLRVASSSSLPPTADLAFVPGQSLPLTIEVFGRTVSAVGCICRSAVVAETPPTVMLGLTFKVMSASDEALLQRLWIESQRREIAPAARHAPAPAPTSGQLHIGRRR